MLCLMGWNASNEMSHERSHRMAHSVFCKPWGVPLDVLLTLWNYGISHEVSPDISHGTSRRMSHGLAHNK